MNSERTVVAIPARTEHQDVEVVYQESRERVSSEVYHQIVNESHNGKSLSQSGVEKRLFENDESEVPIAIIKDGEFKNWCQHTPIQ